MTDQELSRIAAQLHREWDSPDLWSRIEDRIQVGQAIPPANKWPLALAVAATVLLGLLLSQPLLHRQTPSALLTDEAFREVQQAETAYVRSIDKLSAMAAPTLDRSPAPLAAAYRQKLDVLDSAIDELKRTAEGNRYNTYVETQLASLYHEKQKTLQDWLHNATQN